MVIIKKIDGLLIVLLRDGNSLMLSCHPSLNKYQYRCSNHDLTLGK